MSLAEKLEVWGFEEDTLIYKDCSLGTVLKLTPRDANCATDPEINAFHAATCDFLNGLPTGVSLQFVQVAERGAATILEKHKAQVASPDALTSRLIQTRVERLAALDAEGAVPKPTLYLVIRRAFVRRPEEKKGWFKFWKKEESQDWNRDLLRPELALFKQLVRGIRSSLEAIGIVSSELQAEEIYSLCFDQWNPHHPVEDAHFNPEDLRDDLILNDLVVSLKGFSIGAVYHRVISLKIMPEQTFASMSEKLRKLPIDSKLFLSIETLDQGKETFALETQRRIAYALYAGKKGVSDLNNQAKLADIEQLLAKRVSGTEKIFSASLTVVLRDESEEVLSDQVEKVLQAIRELSGAEGMAEGLAASQIFLELSLPNARSRERSRRMNTSVLADFLPLLGAWEGHADPKMLLRNRTGTLLGFDPFSPTLTNYNQIVSGGSGAGKSFLTNLILAHLMKEAPKVFILDIGGSYQKMTENLGGQYVPLGAASLLSINPFDLTDSSEEAVDQKIKFLTSLVELMTKEEQSAGIGKLERAEIERCIKDVLAKEEQARLSHLREKLLGSAEPVLERMGKILGPWCGDSPFGKFVDRATNLELKSRIVCFDLKGLESNPDLQAVCLFLITDLIWREVQRDRTSLKVVVFDECWRLLESEAGSRFIGEVFRTFRKYNASAIAISQTMDDFGRSKVASAILPNAATKWVLKQTGGNLSSLQEMLLLNDREMSLIESVISKKGHFSEAFLIAGDNKQVVAVESTPLEYWLATTDPSDLAAFGQERSRYPGKPDLEHLLVLADRYPRGVAVGSD